VPVSTRSLWLLWGTLFATLLGWLALPSLAAPRAEPWNAAESAVAGFVVAIFALVGGIGTFAARESLVLRGVREGRIDAATEAGLRMLLTRLGAIWLLCAAIGSLGGLMSWGSGRLGLALPYLAGAAALFVLHAPRARFLRRLD
jgi:hypothetical protein